jgi:hypothetical protein
MHKILALTVAAMAATALVPLTASAAPATPPGNDKPSGAVSIHKGETVKEDTTQATTGSLDHKINERCGAPYTNASVWFQYTATDDKGIVLNASGSDFGVGIMVFRGSAPTPDSLFRCGPTEENFRTNPGRTFTIMVFTATRRHGGDLSMTVRQAPPPPTVSVVVRKNDVAYPTGNARVNGTYTCANGDFVESFGELTQVWKRLRITGPLRFFSVGLCDGLPHHWTKTVHSDNGLYGAGVAQAHMVTIVCGVFHCARQRITEQITLKAPQLPSGGTASAIKPPAPTVSCGAGSGQTMWLGNRPCAIPAVSAN